MIKILLVFSAFILSAQSFAADEHAKVIVNCTGGKGAAATSVTLFEPAKRGKKRTLSVSHGSFKSESISVETVPGAAPPGLEHIAGSDASGEKTIVNFIFGDQPNQPGSIHFHDTVTFDNDKLNCKTVKN